MSAKLVVAQSGGPTPVINSSLAGVLDEAAQHAAIGAVLGAREGILGVLEERFADLSHLDAATRALLRGTPGAALGSCRHKLDDDEASRVVAACRRHEVRYLLYIGGNDSADTAHRVHEAAVRAGYTLHVLGVPKTIDNDLPLTDHTPGYGSVARFVALATVGAGRDVEAMRRSDPVRIVEVMGRYAGWLAAASVLGKREDADAPHLVYVPERPLSEDRFLANVERVYRRLGFCVAVVSEHLPDADGEPLGSPRVEHVDAFGHRYHESPAKHLAELTQARLGLRSRFDKPGSIQRMLGPLVSRVDAEEAYLVGREAVRAALAGHSDEMVILVREGNSPYRCRTALASLPAIANKEKLLPAGFIAESGDFVTEAFRDYARPLIGDPLPEYVRLP